jgi:hypothetical protein
MSQDNPVVDAVTPAIGAVQEDASDGFEIVKRNGYNDIRKQLKYVSISRCFYDKHEPENTALVGILLSLKHASGRGETRTTAYGWTGNRGMGGGKAPRITASSNSKYDRILRFGDLCNRDGKCFVLMLKDNQEIHTYLSPALREGSEMVGDVFIIEEPKQVKSFLGDGTSEPILERPRKIIPIQGKYKTNVTKIDPRMPEVGNTLYFAQHNQRAVRISCADVVEACCSGRFCDRQLVMGPNQKCGCVHVQAKHIACVVLEMSIVLACPMEFEQNGLMTLEMFRSWRTSQMFVQDYESFERILQLKIVGDDSYLDNLRECVQNVMKEVNENGGWTYIGWIRRGLVVDTSDTTGVAAEHKVGSINKTVHLSYLYPTNEDLWESLELTNLKYKHADVVA